MSLKAPDSVFNAMRVDFVFGKSTLGIELTDGFRYRLLEARFAVPLSDPREAIEKALDALIGCPALAELARGKRSAAISVCDITRPVPNRELVPPILGRLEGAGIARDKITILIAGLARTVRPRPRKSG